MDIHFNLTVNVNLCIDINLYVFISFVETSINDFMLCWRTTWPNETVPPKYHFLEDHVVPFIRKWKVGLGFYGEQGIVLNFKF